MTDDAHALGRKAFFGPLHWTASYPACIHTAIQLPTYVARKINFFLYAQCTYVYVID